MNLFAELRRRNVFRVAAAYAVVAWLVVQVGDVAADNLGFPDWFMPMLFVLLGLGFPVAIFLAWAFELTPEGMKREKDVAPDESIAPTTGRKLDRLIIMVLVLVLAVLLAERFWPDGDDSTEAEIDRSIAVLPFDDYSPGGDDAWFANGLAEEILNALAQTPDLRVASRTSSFRYRDSEQPVTEIGEALGVAHVLEGSVRRSAERIRVTAQLIRSDDGFHVWSETYDRAPDEVISIQEDIAADIATALETAMDPEALREMVRVGTRSVEAYTAFLRGNELVREAGSTGRFSVGPALEALERARRIDPGFAEATYQLAQLYREAAQSSAMPFAEGLSSEEAWRRAQAAIQEAVDAAGSSPARLKYEAFAADMQMNFELARTRLSEYLEQRPNDLLGWQDYLNLGRKLQNVAMVRRAAGEMLRIAPDDPSVVWDVGAQMLLTGPALIEEGADQLARALALDPGSEEIQYQAHRGFLWAGRFEAAEHLEPGLLSGDLDPRFKTAVRIRAACRVGDRQRAEAAAAEASKTWTRWYVQKILGNQAAAERVLAPLDETAAGRDDLANFLIYPFFDPSPYPNLSAQLAREGIRRPPPAEIPFACPPDETASVAVLPFVNMSADAEQEYFSDGMTEEIINALVRRTDVSVAARTSVFAFKNHNRNVSEIGRELGVTHVIEGSVRSANDMVRITAQLIDVGNGFHEWSETFDRELVDVFAVQEEIAESVAAALSETLAEEPAAPAALTTADPEAYRMFLQARRLLRLRGTDNLERADELLGAVTEIDPGFAPAWATAAIVADVSDDLERAFEYAERALALDPENVDALTALASSHRASWQWHEAERVFERAMALDPESSELLEDYAEFLGMTGRVDEMLEVAERGYLIDPYLAPLTGAYAEALLIHGRPDDADRALLDSLTRGSPGWLETYRVAAALAMQRPDRAAAVIEGMEFDDTGGTDDAMALAVTALRSPGDPQTLDALEAYLLSLDSDALVRQMLVHLVLLHAGRPEPVLRAQQAYLERNVQGELEWIWAPIFDDLRALPGFLDLLESVDLPAYWDANGWPDYCSRLPSGEIECR
ncbi:MAG: hypothetical protein R3323_02165 [Wenzhouxiangellaceae bacterium]|nr:hypothetical protein [Wenzhouxiangellaceae bacterium]